MTHSDQRSLRSNTLWRLTQVMGSGGFAALYVLIYTALLTKGEYGTYGAVVSVAGFLLLVAIFGMRQTLTRFVARARGAGELGSVRAYIVTALRLTGAFTALVVIASWMCTPLLVRTFTGWTPWITLLVTFNVSARAFVQVLQGALEGSSRFRDVSLRAMTLDVLQLAGVGTLALSGMSLVRLLAVECVVQTVGVLIFAHHVRAAVLAHLPHPATDPTVRRELLWFGFPLLINGVGGFLYGRVDMLFIQAYLSPEDTADYFLMFNLFNFPLLAVGAYIYVLSTDVAHSLGRGDARRIRRLFWRSEAAGAGLGVLLAAAYFGLSYILPIFLPAYQGAMVLMRIAAPLLIVKCVAQVASGAFMVSLGRAKSMASFTVIGGLVNVGLNWLLIPPYGTPGAVYSTLVGHTVMGLLTLWYVWRGVPRLDIPPRQRAT